MPGFSFLLGLCLCEAQDARVAMARMINSFFTRIKTKKLDDIVHGG